MNIFVHRLSRLATRALVAGLLTLMTLTGVAVASDDGGDDTTIKRRFFGTTQGALWPPSEVVDSEGNFIVVGTILQRQGGGRVVARPGAALVSKDTVPPLDAGGRETFDDPLAAAYTVIRSLSLRPGSPDLDLVLHASSYGPSEGDFGGGGRIPRQGESAHNLSSWSAPCRETFPTASQAGVYTRPSYALNEVPVWGFRGDQVAYDAVTGEVFTPRLGSGVPCFPFGCLGEDPIDERRSAPITLGDHLRARGEVRVTLTDLDPGQQAYTAARFDLRFEGLLPHSVYTVWADRLGDAESGAHPDPLGFPNLLISDDEGKATASFDVRNPFPEASRADGVRRIVGLTLAFHPDYQSWGGCFGRLGPGVDIVRVLATRTPAWRYGQLTSFVTVEPAP